MEWTIGKILILIVSGYIVNFCVIDCSSIHNKCVVRRIYCISIIIPFVTLFVAIVDGLFGWFGSIINSIKFLWKK